MKVLVLGWRRALADVARRSVEFAASLLGPPLAARRGWFIAHRPCLFRGFNTPPRSRADPLPPVAGGGMLRRLGRPDGPLVGCGRLRPCDVACPSRGYRIEAAHRARGVEHATACMETPVLGAEHVCHERGIGCRRERAERPGLRKPSGRTRRAVAGHGPRRVGLRSPIWIGSLLSAPFDSRRATGPPRPRVGFSPGPTNAVSRTRGVSR